MKTGIYNNISNEDYHNGKGISKSGLDLIEESASSYEWQKKAPVDNEKLKTLELGTDFHAFFLEPEKFKEDYRVLPVFNRRKKDEKQAELDLIEDWKKQGITFVTDEDFKKLNLMRDSALSHPTVRQIMEMNWQAEQSVYWKDSETDVLCRCRPDLIVPEVTTSYDWQDKECNILVPDLKTTGDITKVDRSIADYRYHVQDAFYSSGVSEAYKGNVDFMFIFVSTKINCGRYSVRVMRLSDASKFEGEQRYKSNLRTYEKHLRSNDWATVEQTDIPMWAYKDEEIYQ